MHVQDQNLPSGLYSGESRKLTGNLQVTLFVDQQVLRFKISVEYTMRVTIIKTFDELVSEFLPSALFPPCLRREPTLTMFGPSPSLSPIVSMYFFRSRSRNSNTRKSFASECTMSSNLSSALVLTLRVEGRSAHSLDDIVVFGQLL